MCLCVYACMCLYNWVAIICIFCMFSTPNKTCGKTVLMMEEQQGLCHLSFYCKVLFSKLLHYTTPPFQWISGLFKGVKIKKDVMFLRRVGTRLEY